MVPITAKRPPEGEKPAVKKRQKVGDFRKGNPGSLINSGEVVPISELPWSEVALPDRLDDAEGFFGLEEIENIEVVRDFGNGKVFFKESSNTTLGKGVAKKQNAGAQVNPTDKLGDTEWNGFNSEDHTEVDLTTTKLAKRARSDPNSKSKQRKKKLKANKIDEQELKKTNENTFGTLGASEAADVDVSAWVPLGLASETLLSLAKLGFTDPTPIQKTSIPEILNGHDVVGKASTGSGKTLAFGIPILEHFLSTINNQDQGHQVKDSHRQRPPLAMILSPTRELAHQLATHLTDLCSIPSTASPRVMTVTGGLSLQKQQRLLANADIIIGTPGRLWEIIRENNEVCKWLGKIKFLVVDEADRLLSEGHFKEVEEILESLDRPDRIIEEAQENNSGEEETSGDPQDRAQRQTLVFSATFQKELQQKLTGKSKTSGGELLSKQESMDYLLKKLNFREEKPKFIDVNPVSQMASGLREGIVECAGLEKDLYLYAVLMHHPNTRTLIFTNSISSVRRLTPFLQNLNIPAHALHSQMPQKARLRSIERFSSTSSPGSILVATDVAARGLDIPSVQLIIHYHVPRAADMYVHRSGRTARATKTGSSIILCAPEEVQGVRRLVAKVHARSTGTETDKTNRFFMRTIDLDRRIVARLKPRVTLSKKISDSSLAKEKRGHEDNWLRTAAEDLGVEYDSEDFAAQEGSKKGRGSGRKKSENEARALSKSELGALKGELKGLLRQRVNVGVSESYLSAGGLDVDELLRDGVNGDFLGKVHGIGLD